MRRRGKRSDRAAAEPASRQSVTAIGGSAYGTVCADIHVFGDNDPLYTLRAWSPPPEPVAKGRDDDFAYLRRWSRKARPLAACWLYGPGDPRRAVARFAADRAGRGWRVLTATLGPDARPTDHHEPTADRPPGLLMIVEAADEWPLGHLTWLLSNSALHRPGPVRILLVARSADRWPAVRAALANHQADVSGRPIAADRS